MIPVLLLKTLLLILFSMHIVLLSAVPKTSTTMEMMATQVPIEEEIVLPQTTTGSTAVQITTVDGFSRTFLDLTDPKVQEQLKEELSLAGKVPPPLEYPETGSPQREPSPEPCRPKKRKRDDDDEPIPESIFAWEKALIKKVRALYLVDMHTPCMYYQLGVRELPNDPRGKTPCRMQLSREGHTLNMHFYVENFRRLRRHLDAIVDDWMNDMTEYEAQMIRHEEGEMPVHVHFVLPCSTMKDRTVRYMF